MDLQYIFLLYVLLIVLIYIWKPEIFKINQENNKRKNLYLIFLIIIIAIISFYSKVLFEWFF